MSRYAIWDKQTTIITPSGKIFTPDEWKAQYPVAALDNITVVCGAGEINGSFFGTLGQMVDMYTDMGCDFSECVTNQDKLDAIENFEKQVNTPSSTPTPEERTAAALEFMAMSSMPDVTE